MKISASLNLYFSKSYRMFRVSFISRQAGMKIAQAGETAALISFGDKLTASLISFKNVDS